MHTAWNIYPSTLEQKTKKLWPAAISKFQQREMTTMKIIIGGPTLYFPGVPAVDAPGLHPKSDHLLLL